jgi:hypothetical protein
VVVCAGKTSAAQPWRWRNADNMRTTMGQRQVDGKQGSAHDGGLCSHDSWPKKGKALAGWRVLSRVGAGGKPKLGDTRRNKGSARSQGKGARAAMTAAAPASDRLGSALRRWRVCAAARAGSGQHTNNELTRLGPASARRLGPQQGEGMVLTSVTTGRRDGRRGRDGGRAVAAKPEAERVLEQRKQGFSSAKRK